MTSKTEIEFELNETIAYTRRDERSAMFCPGCQTVVEMATPRIAAVLAHSTEREVFRRVEAGEVHFLETDGVLICLDSLNQLSKKPKEILEK